MSAHRSQHDQRTVWLALLAGPVAWATDESIALVIAAGACGDAGRSGSASYIATVAVSLLALGVVAFAAASANRLRRRMDDSNHDALLVDERTRFLTTAALIVAAITGFGILLRLVSALAGLPCA
jgi:heme/copper-type cytochrome/quinol oxidase subunit 2